MKLIYSLEEWRRIPLPDGSRVNGLWWGWVLWGSVLTFHRYHWCLIGRLVPMMFWAVPMTHCSAMSHLSWAVHEPCQFMTGIVHENLAPEPNPLKFPEEVNPFLYFSFLFFFFYQGGDVWRPWQVLCGADPLQTLNCSLASPQLHWCSQGWQGLSLERSPDHHRVCIYTLHNCMASQSTLTTLDTITHARCWRFSSSYPKHPIIFLCSAACTIRLKQPLLATWGSVCPSQGNKPLTLWWLYHLLNLHVHHSNPKKHFLKWMLNVPISKILAFKSRLSPNCAKLKYTVHISKLL